MGKKTRTPRKKRNGGLSLDDIGNGSSTVDILPEDHTVADSITTFDDEYFEDDIGDDVDVEDLLSTGSVGSNASLAASNRQHKLVETLSGLDDLLAEKRASKREAGLKRLFRSLTQYATGPVGQDTVLNYLTELIQLCNNSLRGGTAAEQYASCRVLEALGVVLGGNSDHYVEEIHSFLERVVKMTTRASAVRGAALRALSLCHFVCSTDGGDGPVMDLCESLAQPEFRNHAVPPTLRATALDCWALLATTLHDAFVSGEIMGDEGRGVQMLPLLRNCLDDASLELRSASGECLALIHECRLNLGDGEDKFARGSWDVGTESENLMSEIQQRIAELSTESGHYMSKRQKKQQRATFREYQATLVDDEPPDETVSFRGGSLTLSTWKELIQLNFARHCLQGGFQVQLLTNPTLQAIFGADGHVINGSGTLSQLEKRLLMSKTSEAAKMAHVDMTKKRRVRNNVKNHFLTTDGEGI
mmetsp:Transcript_18127/g.26907  ORF Transcript_18127/g.26907 Transcript_18127/m.26907 type:complete len:474 (-) Transcript_18127:100-1521(-)|eukprot:CAMPEP_0194062838 /NCGR_PEP_ID=MMETSP0009_2-20130614/78699_1 /TAXON_ID=210454 /ORGANISM="Grammatophora oceanica, Strain CCMP 410" /LENGTH=473 /DNA_ID=CAMNT_0038714735 /DNA_START=51 /DNA_END=1472 /DNA_ORIENTATION=-